MKYMKWLIILLILTMNIISAKPSLIVTNFEAAIYSTPDQKSKKIEYKFQNNEFILVDNITNIGSQYWYHFNRETKKIGGWVIDKIGNYYADDDIHNYMLSNELYFDYYHTADDLFDIKFRDYKNSYYSIQYNRQGEYEGDNLLSIYKTNEGIKEVINDVIGKNIIFEKDYIITYDSNLIEVYNSKEVTEEKYTKKIYYKKTFDFLIKNIVSNKNLINGSFDLDEKNLVLTAKVKYDSKADYQTVVYKFKDGKFEPFSESNNQPSSDSSKSVFTLTGDNVNVRAEAATNGAVLVKLSKGAKVTLLKRSDAALTVGDKKGFWAYIDTGITNKAGNETIKGWVFDYYLKEEK